MLHLKCYIESFYININWNKIKLQYFTVACEKSKAVCFATSIVKNIAAPTARAKFPAKLICCITFGSASSACCLLKSIAIEL